MGTLIDAEILKINNETNKLTSFKILYIVICYKLSPVLKKGGGK